MDDYKKIEFAEQDQITLFDTIAIDFFQKILNLDYRECFVSDESSLSDFSSCGLPDGLWGDSLDLRGLYALWDRWVIAEIEKVYQVTLDETTINLVDLFNRIDQARKAPVH